MLRRVRYDGVMRCSRVFHHDGAALVVVSQLGPGVVRGDELAVRGTVGAGAHLVVTAQAATRVLGGDRAATSEADWDVARGGALELVSEPLIARDGARYVSACRVALAQGARVLLTEALQSRGMVAVTARVVITLDGRECFYDAIELERAGSSAIGTLALFGLTPGEVETVSAMLEAVGAGACEVGVGSYPEGVVARVRAPSLWDVREMLQELRSAAASA